MVDDEKLDPIRSALLEHVRPAGIRHGFFTRAGGVSEGLYRGLNTGASSGDDTDRVGENRRRIAAWMGVAASHLLTAYQVHSPDAVIVREPFAAAQRPRADGLVTDRPGLALGASSADCGPVLFADPKGRVIGAAHAGWKGALTGVIESTLEAMEQLGARRGDIIAALGPSIGARDYEVGPEFVERFVSADAANARYFAPSARPGHAMFDLPAYTVGRLRQAGVEAEWTGHSTYGDEANFYSYRRATHRGEPDYGRHISAIVLEES